jgi:hypothetical protein
MPTTWHRFNRNVRFEGDCWIWQGTTDKWGYGRFTPTTGRSMQAHRWSYEQFVDDIPLGYEVDHLCNTPSCVNPRHLEAVDADTHHQRTIARRTACRNGHDYTEANTRIDKNGRRWCRTCDRERQKKHRTPHVG